MASQSILDLEFGDRSWQRDRVEVPELGGDASAALPSAVEGCDQNAARCEDGAMTMRCHISCRMRYTLLYRVIHKVRHMGCVDFDSVVPS